MQKMLASRYFRIGLPFGRERAHDVLVWRAGAIVYLGVHPPG